MENLNLIIAENVVFLRKQNSMTQKELAEKLGCSDKAISKWERGESVPSIAVLKAVADIFNVTVDYLITREHFCVIESLPSVEPEELNTAKKEEKSARAKKSNSIKSLFAKLGRK